MSFVTSLMQGYDAFTNGDGLGVLWAGTDIGFGGLATFGGTLSLTAGVSYFATSYVIQIPWVYSHTVTPIVDRAIEGVPAIPAVTDFLCSVTANC